MNKKIVCWIGNAPNHRALAKKLLGEFNVVGIVVDRKKSLQQGKWGYSGILIKVIEKLRFGKIDRAWHHMQHQFQNKGAIPSSVPVLEVDNINDISVMNFTKELNPDLIIVSGTSMIKKPLVTMDVPIGKMNLHTGISPFVKGGPNCTNWCIANNEWGSIGNTIMWLSAGIDSGNIIVSERTSIDDKDDLESIHIKVMEHAHDLYGRAIRYVLTAEPPYQSIPQSSLGKGNLYLTRMWTWKQKKKLLKNLTRKRNLDKTVPTIPLPS